MSKQKHKKRRIKKVITDDRKPRSEYVFEGFILLSSFLISLAVAIVSMRVKLDAFQTISLTMLAFICSEYIGHSFIEKSKYFRAKKEYPLIEQGNEWSSKLYEMNAYCKTILENSHGSQDLFLVASKKSIDNLHYFLQSAARDEKVEISSEFIVNSVGVFDALNVAQEKIIELTFPIDDIKDGVLQTPEDKKFFETAYRMVRDGYVETIKVILILKEASLLQDKRLAALCRFYVETDGFEAKYILKEDFVKACDSNMISKSQLDFGIYGPRMLFRVESYEPYKGVYTKSTDEVRRYHKLFDELWNFESVTHDFPIDIINITGNLGTGGNMTLSDLFSTMSNVP